MADAGQVAHRRVEVGHERSLATVFGQVTVRRLARLRGGRMRGDGRPRELTHSVETHLHATTGITGVTFESRHGDDLPFGPFSSEQTTQP